MIIDIKQVYGNTYYFTFPGMSIPFYRLDDSQIVLVDSGFKKNGLEVADYLDQHHIHVRAIIHTHMHVDHIGGDAVFIPRDNPDIFGSVWEMRQSFELHTRAQIEHIKKNEDIADDETVGALEAIKDSLIDTMGLDHLDIDDARFVLIPAPGHSLKHQLIATPDGVCCIGDTLMHGTTLARSKAPYSYNLVQDIRTKRSLVNLDYEYYIAAHEDSFSKKEMPRVIDNNLAIYSNVLKNVARLEEAEPSVKVVEATKDLLKNIGIRGHNNTMWLSETIREYFNYYSKYHTDKLPE